jgi:hypothetical protein
VRTIAGQRSRETTWLWSHYGHLCERLPWSGISTIGDHGPGQSIPTPRPGGGELPLRPPSRRPPALSEEGSTALSAVHRAARATAGSGGRGPRGMGWGQVPERSGVRDQGRGEFQPAGPEHAVRGDRRSVAPNGEGSTPQGCPCRCRPVQRLDDRVLGGWPCPWSPPLSGGDPP